MKIISLLNINMDIIQTPCSCLFLSKRNVGKTVLCEYLVNILLEMQKLNVVYVFSKTCFLGDNWRTIPKKYKADNIDYKKIKKIMDVQMKACQAANNSKKPKPVKQVGIVFDDVIESSSNKRVFVDLLNELYTRGRHFKISVFLCNQYVKNVVTPTVRSNLDYIFISINTEEVLNFAYNLIIFEGRKDDFVQFIIENTRDHYFVMYDNLSQNEDKFYNLRADIEYLEGRQNKY